MSKRNEIKSSLRLIELIGPKNIKLERLLTLARKRVNSMTDVEIQQMHETQRDSWVRGENGMGLNG